MTIRCLLGALALTLSTAAPLAAQSRAVIAYVVDENDDTRTLVHEAEINAPVATVWKALSTAEGWKMWGPAFAKFDLRHGGSIETGYHPDTSEGDPRNIRHRILAFVPERMIAMRVEYAPPGPVDPELVTKLWGVYELEPLENDRTRLRISGLGYGSDEASTRLLDFFKQGNVWSIDMLRKNIAEKQGEE